MTQLTPVTYIYIYAVRVGTSPAAYDTGINRV